MMLRRRCSSCCLLWLTTATTSTFSLVNISASSYNAYQYDMATPQFTPDGRLLQVEYAAAAASHSSPILAIPVVEEGEDEAHEGQKNNMALVLLNLKSSRMAQDRFILLSPPVSSFVSSASSATKTATSSSTDTIDNNVVVVAMSGVVADNIALLRHVHKAMEQDLRTYGSIRQTSSSSSHNRGFANGSGIISFILRAIARQCHLPTVGGGIRPFGSTMLVCGWESTNHNPLYVRKLVVWQCQPSGALQPVSLDQIHVVGGGESAQQEVLKRLVLQGISDATAAAAAAISSDSNQNSDSAENNALGHTLKGAVRALLAHRQRQEQLRQETPNSQSSIESPEQHGEDVWSSEEVDLECVVLSPRHGVHRLTSHQIASLLSQCAPQQSSPSPQ